MNGRGLDKIPLRIPTEWDAKWFETFVREVLSLADARNAIDGVGVSITGDPTVPATISASADVEALVQASLVTVLPSDLQNGRVLAGEPDVVDIDDDGPGDTVTINLVSVPFGKLLPIPSFTVLGNPTADEDRPSATPILDVMLSENVALLDRDPQEFTGGVQFSGKMARFAGAYVAHGSGPAVEMGVSSPYGPEMGFFVAYDRTTNAYLPIGYEAVSFRFQPAGMSTTKGVYITDTGMVQITGEFGGSTFLDGPGIEFGYSPFLSSGFIQAYDRDTSAHIPMVFQCDGITYFNATNDPIFKVDGDGSAYLPEGLADYADDTAAAGGGIVVNQFYRTGSTVKIRVS